ncbi:ARD/ARD' family-domain-containing protein, partial [Mycena sanguinolenta]
YFDNLFTDQRLPRPVSADTLVKLGVLSWHIPVDGHEAGDDFEVNKVAKERGYKNRDVINVSQEGIGAVYEEKIRGFFEEQMHEDEEIRYILSGSGFFDVRECAADATPPTDAWIHIAVASSDLLVLPAGIYHRFTLDTKDQIRTLRLFKDEPKWIPHARSAGTSGHGHERGGRCVASIERGRWGGREGEVYDVNLECTYLLLFAPRSLDAAGA